MDISSFIWGAVVANAIWWIVMHASRKPKEAPPAPKPRQAGDVVMHIESGLPVVLLNMLNFNKFEGCFITPHADRLGAGVKAKGLTFKTLESMTVLLAQDRNVWPDYPHPLSGQETANFTKAMLDVK